MDNCNDTKDCGGRRAFLVKSAAVAGGIMLSLSGAATSKAMGDADETVIKIDMSSDLVKKGSQTFETSAGKIIVIHDESGFKAYDAKCTHKGGPLAYDAASKTLSCPWHGSKFDGANGAVKNGPATAALTGHDASGAVVIGLKARS